MKSKFQETDEKSPRELLKEVLRRANKKEKQEYQAIIDRQTAINQRLEEIISEEEDIDEKDEMNEFPESKTAHSSPSKTHEEIMRMSSGELHEWCEQTCREADESIAESKRWREEFAEWSTKRNKYLLRRMDLIKESITLSTEYLSLEYREKWLLLSIALRSQPNLMRYIKGSDEN